MGGQLTKEQARLPFGYVSVKNNRRRITPTIKPNVHPSPDIDTSESLLNELVELNNHLQTINNSHLTLITPGETASIITTGTDVISPEVLMEIDKPEDDAH